MNSTQLLMYLVVGAGFAAVACIVFFNNRNKGRRNTIARALPPVKTSAGASGNGRKPAPEVASTEGIDQFVEVDARIYDNATRTVKNGVLAASDVRQIRQDYENLGRRWYRDNEWRYAVVRLSNGKCMPVQRFITQSLKNPPERLHRALQQAEAESYYKPRDNRSVLAKYGAYILFAIAAMAILFLWGATILQG